MPFVTVSQDTELYYEERGAGQPVIFLHGVWMSSRFFQKQLDYFSKDYRVIALDFRGHGQSSPVHGGHTIEVYARDLETFMDALGLQNAVLAGWSMGAFVVWEYLKQFGSGRIHSTVIVDELASDFKWPDFEIGAFDIETLTAFMREIQTNRPAFLASFLASMFKEELPPETAEWMLAEVTRMPESVASAILYDQSIVDYRHILPQLDVRTLLCFGREEKVIPVAAGEHLLSELPDARLEVFENSCHCPFWEEANLFNQKVDSFIREK